MANVAIVILNYNGASMLRQFLPKVLACCATHAQVIVADNASTDESLDIMRSDFPSVPLIRLNKNWGFAEGYNRALQEVDADYFILLNSDIEVTLGWVEPMLALMEADRTIAACQPKLLDYKQKTHFEYAGAAGGFIDYYGYPYCRGRIFDCVEPDNGQYDKQCDIFWATGAALMIRAEDFRSVGGFDGTFFAHMEEIDLCWRLRARGRRIVVVPQSIVYHVGGATLSYNNPRKTFLNFRNNLLMLYKNLPQKELNSVMRVRRILDYIAAFKFLISGCMGDFKAIINARRMFNRIKGEYTEKRKENLSAAKVNEIPERVRYSILWRYYFGGKKYFNELR